jgi:hypothetical protein
MTTLTIKAETRRTLEILDDACDKLHTAIAVLFVAGQIEQSAMDLDEFKLTEIICDSMPGDMTFEDLAVLGKSGIYRMCYHELTSVM